LNDCKFRIGLIDDLDFIIVVAKGAAADTPPTLLVTIDWCGWPAVETYDVEAEWFIR
jgi:hypothetical protein